MSEQAQNLNQIFLVALSAYAEETCLQIKRGSRYRPVRFSEVADTAFRVAAFLHRERAVAGERVVIAAPNSKQWIACYFACQLCGAVVVPVRYGAQSEEIGFILEESQPRVVMAQGAEELKVLDGGAERWQEMHSVLVVERAKSVCFATTSVASLNRPDEAERDRILREAEAVAGEAVASIQYTADETGQLRGAVFTQRQRVESLRQLGEWVPIDRDDLAFSVLTWGYAPSLLFTLRCLVAGVPSVLAESRELAFENLRESSPTLAMVTPYGLERFYNQVMSTVSQLSRSRRDVFRWALSIGREYRAAGPAGPAELREGYARADRTFFSQIRAELGGRLRRIFSVGAPLSPHVRDFAEAIGLEPMALYGLTEAGGFPAIQRPGSTCPATCGQVGTGYQIRIADDDEVMVRGDAVMKEYWRRPEETHEVLDADGWLRTGDLGRFDPEGNLHLTGHKRSLFVLSTGRTVTPTAVENAWVADPLVAQAVVFGEGRPYVTALIVPDLTAVASRLRESGLEVKDGSISIEDPEVVELFESLRGSVNEQLGSWEKVERLTLLAEPLSESTGELSVSMTLHRQVVGERHRAKIDAMYPYSGALDRRQVTQVQLDPEQLRELFEKQDILDAWMADAGIGFLFEIAREQRIHPPSMVHICEIAAAIAQMQSEEKALSTALIVGDPARIGRVLPESEIQLQRYDHVRRMRQVVITLAEMVDGLVLGFVLDQNGYLRGIHKLEVALDDPTASQVGVSDLLGPQFRRHAAISQRCDAMVFFVPNGGRQVRVFSQGRLIGRYASGNWSAESLDRVDGALRSLAEGDAYGLRLLQRLMRCAFRMSEENLGAIFIVGDAEAILKLSDPPAVGAFANILSAPVKRLSDSELINFAKQDGATVIDAKGHFRACKVLLRPAAETEADIGADKGARHSSAAKMSAEIGCLAICVSQDGPITAYEGGRQVFSL